MPSNNRGTSLRITGLVLAGLVLLATSALLPGALAQAQGDDGAAPAPFPGNPLPNDRDAFFAGSGACASCHSQLTDAAGNDVSIGHYWRATMMANAARDPYWQASVSIETANLPQYTEVIEDKCALCHTPLAHFSAMQAGASTRLFEDGFLSAEHAAHALAMDGNSCTLCHQIEDVAFGEPESFSGRYTIDATLPAGERLNYSRFAVNEQGVTIMRGASGFIPTQATHIGQAEMCATCHTLYTPYVDDTAAIVGEFPEQTPYLEWLGSAYADNTPCQSCHMPQAEGAVVTSITGGDPREPFFKHTFVGGNAYMMDLFLAHGAEMGATASSEHFTFTREQTLAQLQERAAVVSLENVGYANATLAFNVVVENRAGHKLPTGFPSRRAWLHITVRDAAGNTVFESGGYTDDGRIIGDDHDADPARFEPHHTVILSSDDVQIYQTIMGDVNGEVTSILLRGAGYLKDNRLLPAGFDADAAHPDVRPSDAALADANFTGGSDRLMVSVNTGAAEGPFEVSVELLYQALSYRWIEKLRGFDTAESARFLGYQETVSNVPVVMASVTESISP
ncbi:MAG: hypothetical protein OZ934_00390 [Anaerolineae bacterium]|nr:hypothetical protein [Anaerolineae bacterium]